MDTNSSLWTDILEKLREEYSETTVSLWFEKAFISELDSESVTVTAEDDFKKSIIEKKYISVLEQMFCEVMGFSVEVKIASADGKDEEGSEGSIFIETDNPFLSDRAAPPADRGRPARSEYTFDTFVVGSSNHLAQAAALSVARHLAEFYNPLFIYGPSGLGKTHLLFAIMNHVRAAHPDYTIHYATGEQFTNELIDALSRKENVVFREKYRKLDLLLVDDIHFIAGKPSVQEEFFNTFNDLFLSNKQIVLTSDRPPSDMTLLEDRLKTRFGAGLLADIQPPDAELRTAIFKMKTAMLGLELPNDVLSFLSETIKSNIRQIEGALKRLRAQSFINSQPITLQMAREVLTDFFSENENNSVTMEKIFAFMIKRYGVKIEELKSKKRSAEIVYVRHITMYLALELAGMSLKNVGRAFDRDHTTVMSARDNVFNRIKKDISFDKEIKEIIKELTS